MEEEKALDSHNIVFPPELEGDNDSQLSKQNKSDIEKLKEETDIELPSFLQD
jgi:hypothetical protein